ncbi:uncharacterized protein [Ptychodera flava]|uniref:uncharacterized protein n=1 Tax=Ptychodera flava TaxID=63121 RepID=UPI003969ED47
MQLRSTLPWLIFLCFVLGHCEDIDGISDDIVSNEEDLLGVLTADRYEPDPKDGSECYTQDDGSDYRGTVSRTSNGRTCQAWTSQSPHQHIYTPDDYPNAGLGDHNYCRNMDGATQPWCYTMDSSVRWEYCDVGTARKACENETNRTGVVYTRWGHSSCPGVTKLIYKGIMAGSFHSNVGNGADYLCLPEVAKYDDSVVVAGHQKDRSYIYPVEYRGSSGPLSSKRYNDVPCAVCLQEYRNNYILYPGRDDCPSGWTREYYGYLMSSKYTEATTRYVCVDKSGGVLASTSTAVNGGFLYPVENVCSAGSGLPCAPYVNGYELTCAICSK